MHTAKWCVFLLFGLTLGIGLFLFIGYSVEHDSAIVVQQSQNENRDESLLLNAEVKELDSISSPIQSEIDNDPDSDNDVDIVASKSAEEVAIKSQREKNFEMLLQHRMEQNKTNDAKKKQAEVEWAKFVENQPHELKVLFDEKKAEGDWTVGQSYLNKGQYLNHFEGGSSDWGSRAISALGSYFKGQAYPNHYILRVNCRESMCEIAGVIQNVDVYPDEYSRTLAILSARWEEITRYMINNNELTELFELRGEANMNYALSEEAGVFSIPYSVFLYRNYVASPVPGPN